MKIKIITLILLLNICMFLNISVEAFSYSGCTYSEVARLRSIVSNINISYDYYVKDSNVYFNITLNNLVPNLYFIDSNNESKFYTYNDTVDGEITIPTNTYSNGNFVFYSALTSCPDLKIGTKYYNLPKYNFYHNSELCKDISEYSLCKKWTYVNYSRNEFERLVDEYKYRKALENTKLEIDYDESFFSKLIKFYIEYYYFFLIGVILVCILIIIVESSRNKFKF